MVPGLLLQKGLHISAAHPFESPSGNGENSLPLAAEIPVEVISLGCGSVSDNTRTYQDLVKLTYIVLPE